jgi:S1-C subfamily serine protease
LLALEKSDDDGNLLNKDIKWLGATLHQLEGEEYSAYGVSKNDGGVAILKIELKTKAKRSGFREGDLIQKVNDQSVCDCTSFLENINRLKGEQVEIKIIRNQQEFIVKYSETLYN